MDKRLKLKLFRVIQFCRSTSAETPSPAIYRLSPVNPKGFDISFPSNNLPAPPSTPEYSFTKRHVSSKAISVNCGCRSGSCTEDLSSDCSFPHYSRKNEAARCNVVSQAYEPKDRRKIGYASRDGDISPVWVKKNKKKSQRKKKDSKTIASTSSRDSICFSSEEDESRETDTLISINSRIFSSDSTSELDHSLESTIDRSHKSENGRKNKKITSNIKKIRRLKRHASKKYKGSNMTGWSPELESPAKASVFRRMIPYTVDGKVRESVAVVKKSVDPYEDFKRSMLEMILEKQMYEAKDLEELLQCFLSLNSRKYHGIIVEAFSEIWEALFCDFPVNGQQVGMGT